MLQLSCQIPLPSWHPLSLPDSHSPTLDFLPSLPSGELSDAILLVPQHSGHLHRHRDARQLQLDHRRMPVGRLVWLLHITVLARQYDTLPWQSTIEFYTVQVGYILGTIEYSVPS